ncbi:MAG TPA: aminopeptidase N [Candidatus Limnocylindria bacterium]
MTVLRREEAAERSRLLRVRSYDVELDFTRGEEHFGSVSRIRFDCSEPGAGTFLDLVAARVGSVLLNGTPVPAECIDDARVTLQGLQSTNEIVATADFSYSNMGEGVHRFTDPADGAVYLWAETIVYNAGRVFGAFDQPDLKAPLRLRVRAPQEWTVLANGAGVRGADGTWTFAETPPLATYLMTVCAGPFHSVYARHGDIPLGLHVRRSLGEHMDADELFEHTRAAFAFYDRIFAVPYPFGKYDQVFCPEFNAGAMENPGCVKFNDRFIYRSRVTDEERALRATVIAHEMAHMWFGDLVTMRWWDDLWLNESFAEYIGTLTMAEATRYASRWTWFCASIKAWGYRQDELPSTHPVAADAPDTDAALLNLDGISYAKGAGVLKQLVAWVGFEAFLAGLHAYFERHAYGSTKLADLLDALEPASGRDLRAWSREWLESAGVNMLRAESAITGDAYDRVVIIQSAPAEHPTLRSHRIAIGLYDRDGERLVRRERLEVDVVGERTDVPALVGMRVPDVLLLNDDDLTWAKIRLDERSLATIRDGGLARIEGSLPRALVWASTWDMTRDAELPVGDYLRLVLDGIGAEREISLVEDVLRRARQAIDTLGRSEMRVERLATFAMRCRELLEGAEPGSDLQLAYARALVAVAAVADADRLRGWLDGHDVPSGLAIDAELRWLIVRRLAVLGLADEAMIAAEQELDPTSNGSESAAGARAAMPTSAAKAAAWKAVVSPDSRSVAVLRAITEDFWHPEQLDVCAPFVDPYLEALPEIWRTRPSETAWGITVTLFPSLLVSAATIDRVDRALTADLDGALRRLLVEGRADLERAMRTRAADR